MKNRLTILAFSLIIIGIIISKYVNYLGISFIIMGVMLNFINLFIKDKNEK